MVAHVCNPSTLKVEEEDQNFCIMYKCPHIRVHAHPHGCPCGGQRMTYTSLCLSSCEYWGLNSGHQAWQQASLPTQLSTWPKGMHILTSEFGKIQNDHSSHQNKITEIQFTSGSHFETANVYLLMNLLPAPFHLTFIQLYYVNCHFTQNRTMFKTISHCMPLWKFEKFPHLINYMSVSFENDT